MRAEWIRKNTRGGYVEVANPEGDGSGLDTDGRELEVFTERDGFRDIHGCVPVVKFKSRETPRSSVLQQGGGLRWGKAKRENGAMWKGKDAKPGQSTWVPFRFWASLAPCARLVRCQLIPTPSSVRLRSLSSSCVSHMRCVCADYYSVYSTI